MLGAWGQSSFAGSRDFHQPQPPDWYTAPIIFRLVDKVRSWRESAFERFGMETIGTLCSVPNI